MRRLAMRQHELGRALTKEEREEVLRSAPLEVARPVAFGVGIILIVFLPILTLEGIEGKLFKPMALTLIFALLGSLILALTLTPVLAALFLPKQVKEKEPWLVRLAHRLYEPALDLALRFRKLTLLGAAGVVHRRGAARLAHGRGVPAEAGRGRDCGNHRAAGGDFGG